MCGCVVVFFLNFFLNGGVMGVSLKFYGGVCLSLDVLSVCMAFFCCSSRAKSVKLSPTNIKLISCKSFKSTLCFVQFILSALNITCQSSYWWGCGGACSSPCFAQVGDVWKR